MKNGLCIAILGIHTIQPVPHTSKSNIHQQKILLCV